MRIQDRGPSSVNETKTSSGQIKGRDVLQSGSVDRHSSAAFSLHEEAHWCPQCPVKAGSITTGGWLGKGGLTGWTT